MFSLFATLGAIAMVTVVFSGRYLRQEYKVTRRDDRPDGAVGSWYDGV